MLVAIVSPTFTRGDREVDTRTGRNLSAGFWLRADDLSRIHLVGGLLDLGADGEADIPQFFSRIVDCFPVEIRGDADRRPAPGAR